MKPFSLIHAGDFAVGCNYWASHAGTRMWSDWRPEVVEDDLQRLSAHGIQVMRVFPLWPDFQPIIQLYGGDGKPREIRLAGEQLLPDTDAGRAGVSEEMLARFEVFADLCLRYDIQLIVGLLTGWMSGRLFVPPALEGHNVLTDPFCLAWELRFVDCFVRRLKQAPVIYAWDLGNECNCMAPVPNHEAAFAWSKAIADAIRAADPARPVISGMHSLGPDEPVHWRIQDQAEATDLLTTHPYPYWTPYVRSDPLNTLRVLLHAAAETKMYADIGGKACLVEETGTMGPMVSNEAAAAAFTRTNLFSTWAHDGRGFLWWCAHDQTGLTHPPYDWTAVERELGLLRSDGSPKPMLLEMQKFRAWRESLPFPALPPRLTEAVCLLTREQDHWAAAYSAFVLAKQAKFDLRFQYIDQPLEEAECYLLPSLCGSSPIPDHRWRALLERVRAGATLYLSLDDGILDGFNALAGVEILTRAYRREAYDVTLAGSDPQTRAGGKTLRVMRGGDLRLALTRAEALALEADGNPVYTRAAYGEGTVYALTFPLEIQLTHTAGAFHAADAQPYWRIYDAFARSLLSRRALRVEHPMLGVTEHPLDEGKRVVVVINYSPAPVEVSYALSPGWQISQTWYGTPPVLGTINLPANDALVLMVIAA